MWTNTVLGMYYVIKSNNIKILKFNKYRIYYNYYYNSVHTVNCNITNCSDYTIYRKVYNILYMGKLK